MAYTVTFTIPARELGKADAEFVVSKKGGVLGTLKVSKGSIVWSPSGTNIGHKAYWGDFAEIAKNEFKDRERR